MRQIKDFVKNHEIMRPLREEIGQSNLLEIVKGLVSDRLFNSNARAMRAFPSLFLPETNAGDKPVYNEIPRRGFSMNHKLTVGNERVFLIDPVGDGEGHATTGSGGSDQTAVDGKQTKKVKDQGTCETYIYCCLGTGGLTDDKLQATISRSQSCDYPLQRSTESSR